MPNPTHEALPMSCIVDAVAHAAACAADPNAAWNPTEEECSCREHYAAAETKNEQGFFHPCRLAGVSVGGVEYVHHHADIEYNPEF